jgi:hypothetical protein
VTATIKRIVLAIVFFLCFSPARCAKADLWRQCGERLAGHWGAAIGREISAAVWRQPAFFLKAFRVSS